MGPRRSFSGFTLVEIVVVLVIVAILIAMAAALTRGVTAAQKRSLTATRMAGVDTALMLYVQQQKRLPCPADGTLVSSDGNAGIERGGGGGACANNQQDGVVPWRTLGITETDATDGWDRRITYRVTPSLALANGLDMSQCDPAASYSAAVGPIACVAGCTSANLPACTHPKHFLKTLGLEVHDIGNTTIMSPSDDPNTAAAYVLISAGESGGGAYLSSGNLGASSSTDGTQESKNYASQPYTPGVTYFVDNSIVDTPGANHFDDIVSRPTILSLANKSGLGPRSH
jgi:prepilin-type N-terminal cleavage/methylation domain-containing protein